MPIASQKSITHIEVGDAIIVNEEAAAPSLCQTQNQGDGHPSVHSQLFESALHSGAFPCLQWPAFGPKEEKLFSKSSLLKIGNHTSSIKGQNVNTKSFQRLHWRDKVPVPRRLLVDYRSLTLGMAVSGPFVRAFAATFETAKSSRINSRARSWAEVRHCLAIEAFSALHRKLAFSGNSDQKATPTHNRYKLPESRSTCR